MNHIIRDGRVLDDDGHLWSVTGYWCRTCAMPLIPVEESTMHPLCVKGE